MGGIGWIYMFCIPVRSLVSFVQRSLKRSCRHEAIGVIWCFLSNITLYSLLDASDHCDIVSLI